jgi:hypothetical protein
VKDGRYFPYARPFLEAKRNSRMDTIRKADRRYENLQTKRWESFNRAIRLRDRLRLEIKQSTPVKDGQLSYAEGEGSDSVINRQNQRVLKLITPVPPYDNFDILFGVSVDTAGFPERWRSRSQGVVGIQNRGFAIIGIKEGDWTANDLAQLVRDTLANIIDPAD